MIATLIEVVTIIGSVIAGGLLGRAFDDYSPQTLVSASIAVMIVFVVLAAIAALGQEPVNADLSSDDHGAVAYFPPDSR